MHAVFIAQIVIPFSLNHNHSLQEPFSQGAYEVQLDCAHALSKRVTDSTSLLHVCVTLKEIPGICNWRNYCRNIPSHEITP